MLKRHCPISSLITCKYLSDFGYILKAQYIEFAKEIDVHMNER